MLKQICDVLTALRQYLHQAHLCAQDKGYAVHLLLKETIESGRRIYSLKLDTLEGVKGITDSLARGAGGKRLFLKKMRKI